jgi:hypothetical protein
MRMKSWVYDDSVRSAYVRTEVNKIMTRFALPHP